MTLRKSGSRQVTEPSWFLQLVYCRAADTLKCFVCALRPEGLKQCEAPLRAELPTGLILNKGFYRPKSLGINPIYLFGSQRNLARGSAKKYVIEVDAGWRYGSQVSNTGRTRFLFVLALSKSFDAGNTRKRCLAQAQALAFLTKAVTKTVGDCQGWFQRVCTARASVDQIRKHCAKVHLITYIFILM